MIESWSSHDWVMIEREEWSSHDWKQLNILSIERLNHDSSHDWDMIESWLSYDWDGGMIESWLKSETTLPYLSRDIHIIWSTLPTVGRVENQPYSSSISLANYPWQLSNETTTFEIEMWWVLPFSEVYFDLRVMSYAILKYNKICREIQC